MYGIFSARTSPKYNGAPTAENTNLKLTSQFAKGILTKEAAIFQL